MGHVFLFFFFFCTVTVFPSHEKEKALGTRLGLAGFAGKI